MIHQFHSDSVTTITGRITTESLSNSPHSFMSMTNNQSITSEINWQIALIGINRSRYRIRQMPSQHLAIYELCKSINQLAVLEMVDFNGATYAEKVALIRLIAPFADNEAIAEGVREYQESCAGKTVQYLLNEEHSRMHGLL